MPESLPSPLIQFYHNAYPVVCFLQGYIACAWGIKNVSLVFICYGVVNAIASFLTGRFSKYVPRLIILLTGAAGNVAACAIMFLWIPNNTSIIYYFVTIGLWGMSDAVWQTLINCKFNIFFFFPHLSFLEIQLY